MIFLILELITNLGLRLLVGDSGQAPSPLASDKTQNSDPSDLLPESLIYNPNKLYHYH